MKEQQKLNIRISRARVNFLFFAILSALNILTLSLSGKFYMPFSSTITTLMIIKSKSLTQETGFIAYTVIGICLAVLLIAALVLIYFKAKNNSKWMLSALIILSVDTLILIFANILLSISDNAFGWSGIQIIDIILHILVLYYLVTGTKASVDLEKLEKKIASGEITETEQTDDITEDIREEKDFDFEYDDEEEPENSEISDDLDSSDTEDQKIQEEDLTQPIGKYEFKNQEPMLKGEYAKLSVFAVCSKGTAELVINGYVCDRLNVKDLSCYKLQAIVNGINFTFEYTKVPHREALFLYAGKELLDSRITDF